MLETILIVLAVVVIALLVVVALQPSDFKISRSAAIAASPSEIFSQVDDFHHWENWSPWAKLDPTMKSTYEGPTTGAGSAYRWSGNNKVGEGKMTVLKRQPSEALLIQLEFLRPMKATNTAEFTFQPDGQGTTVTWSMTGKNGFMAKAFGLLVNIEKMVGSDFEKGLTNLKTIVETAKK